MLAGEDARLEVISALRTRRRAAARATAAGDAAALVGRAARSLPGRRAIAGGAAAGRRTGSGWRRAASSLLVPIFARHRRGARRSVGLIALGQKRSEEPYTPEDRRLLSGIAAQMSVALDLSRLRTPRIERASRAADADAGRHADDGRGDRPRAMPALAMCPTCHRCFDIGCSSRPTGTASSCPDDGDAAAAGDRHAAGRRRQVSRRRRRRTRRHGRGVSRARSAARSRRRDQGRARRAGGRSRVAGALPARGADRRAAAASGHRDGVRLRQPAGRRGVPGDGVRARRGPAAPAEARADARAAIARSS